MLIAVKRVYEPPAGDDGLRVLVDRLWPRGISKDKIGLWFKDIAPSNELRKWYGHDPAKWEDFCRRYLEELRADPEAVRDFMRAVQGREQITLLYSSKEETINNAAALKTFLDQKILSGAGLGQRN